MHRIPCQYRCKSYLQVVLKEPERIRVINPESLRIRIKSNYDQFRIEAQPPSIVSCEIVIKIIAQAVNLSVDEISRRIELSPMKIPDKRHNHNQMDLFSDAY